ncbi:S-layer homology domain-containing protein [Rothia sp. P5764]|uniref:S-layer homology domain-containing protein n=1 Tax=Rothia sp. P5764 TaxID=3402654 RepID=UPI003ACA5F06
MSISRKNFLRLASAGALTTALVGVTSLPSANAGNFTDLAPGRAFYTELTWASEKGIVRGWADGTVRPHAATERCAIAAFFYRYAGSPAFTAPVSPSFKDVPTSHPFYKEIEWFKAQGLTTGWPDGTFRPSAGVERGAVAAFFYRYAGSPAFVAPAAPSFKDVPTSHPFYKEIEWFKAQGLTTGWPDGTFRPQVAAERGAVATFFYRYGH